MGMKARSRTGKRFRSVQRNGPMTWPSMLSSCLLEPPAVHEEMPVDHVRQVPLEASHGLLGGLPSLALAGQVGLGLGGGSGLDQGDVVERPVQLAVPSSVQPVPMGLTRRGNRQLNW